MKTQLKYNKRRRLINLSKKKKVLLMILVILTFGIIYEQIGRYLDCKRFEPVGQIFNINGHDMHIYGAGKGEETVIFTSGWRTPSPYVDYYPLYNEISKYSRIVVYDRPGYGWSEVDKKPRDLDTIAIELHKLLEEAGEKPPYILVGHSFGSSEVLRFAQLYGDEVKGIVLIDGSSPEYSASQKRPSKYFLRHGTIKHTLLNYTINGLVDIGIIRALCNIPDFYTSISPFRNELSLVSDDLKKLDEAMALKWLNNKNHYDELRMEKDKLVANGHLEDIPLKIITSEEYNKGIVTNQFQKDLMEWSTDSEQIVVEGSSHYIHMFNPEAVNNVILDLIE